ncbi:Putative odorant receptor 13a [Trachymyrmex zeteki]|uniref:Putative odorant receptor 13a n=1 Tax=Mycetomoellerius zeteki TaxID=64791 RepID=A0A151XCI1_9HYME|nr:Putative odorant receptor 13a [Trachymyrmex zeteki]
MLKIVGLWPQDSKNQHEELLSKLRFLFNIIMLIFVLAIPALVSLIRVWGDMILMIDNLQYTLPLLITILKIFIMWYKKEVLSPLINMIVNDWIKVKMEEERIVMLKQARIIRLLAICGALLILSTLLITFGSFLFGKTLRHITNLTDSIGKPLPIQSYYLHDVSSSPKYELTYLIQTIAIIISGLSYTAVDSFLGLLILHICGQIENLHLRLLNLGNNSNFKAVLKYNIKDHIRLNRSIEIIDNTFNLMLLGLLFFFGILFCLHGFLIVSVNLEWAISLNRCMLKIIGLWPEKSKNQREELLSKIRFLFNVIMLIFVLTIPALMSLIRVWGDMILMIDNLQYTLPLLITLLKVFIMWYNKRALSPLINMIVKDWIKVKMEEERIVMLKQARIIRLLAICGALLILSTLLITFGSFLFGKTLRHVTNFTDPVGKSLPIQTYYPHDISNSPNFELTYLIQVIGLTTSGLSYTAVDNFLGLLILHICGQVENLHLRLLNLGKNSNFKELLKYNVKDHIRLIRS